MLDKYKKRNSNIELLRIICIWMIVLYHLAMHSFGEQAVHIPLWDIVTNIFHIGVICFLLISGWYGIKVTPSGLIKLTGTCLFYSLLIRIFDVSILGNPLTLKDIFYTFTPILHEEWWFMTSYCVLYIISPFANYLWKILTDSNRTKLLIILGILMFYFGWIGNTSTIHGGRDIITFLFLYYLGNNLKGLTNKHYQYFIFIYLIICAIIIIGAMLKEYIPILSFIIRFSCFGYNSPGLIIMAIAFFMIFAKIKPFYNKWTNYAASSVFPVYLIHENYVTYPYMANLVNLDYSNLILFLLFAASAVIIVIICIVIDKLLSIIYLPIFSIITKCFNKIIVNRNYDIISKSNN